MAKSETFFNNLLKMQIIIKFIGLYALRTVAALIKIK
ncbi:MAG: hypothetical protein JWQ79_2022 [Mucilaginibacter sp.]|nr:hypothetical protein [Mucilaginibacter sp.]